MWTNTSTQTRAHSLHKNSNFNTGTAANDLFLLPKFSTKIGGHAFYQTPKCFVSNIHCTHWWTHLRSWGSLPRLEIAAAKDHTTNLLIMIIYTTSWATANLTQPNRSHKSLESSWQPGCKENAASKTSLQQFWLHEKHPLVHKHLVTNHQWWWNLRKCNAKCKLRMLGWL